MKVTFTDRARQDLLQIGDHIAQFDPVAARQLLRDLRRKAGELGRNPLAFPRVSGREHQEMRRRVYRDYLIFYVADADTVTIVAVCHGARDYDRLLPDDL